ncbi:hypothetical protein [uncultured Jatrophihabitans sp.]|uniref:hypothetical protein n=1 Tax=uncultured Jatrophihabitans sp. TaxID=1610747 RepID=UPI0035CB5185
MGEIDERADEPDVGEFRPGSPTSRWALARYLVGRAIAESIGWTLLVTALALIAGAVVVQLSTHLTFVTVLLAIVALGVLGLRAVLRALLRRLTATDSYAPIEARLRELVGETRRDVRRELRRLGLPSRVITLPLLGVRLAGRRRADTLQRLRGFELGRVVPPVRLDEFHLLLSKAAGAASTATQAGGPFGTMRS